MTSTTLKIGPPAREPATPALARFLERNRHPTLLAYWMSLHMSKHRWKALMDALQAQMDRDHAKHGRIVVQGLGAIGGRVASQD